MKRRVSNFWRKVLKPPIQRFRISSNFLKKKIVLKFQVINIIYQWELFRLLILVRAGVANPNRPLGRIRKNFQKYCLFGPIFDKNCEKTLKIPQNHRVSIPNWAAEILFCAACGPRVGHLWVRGFGVDRSVCIKFSVRFYFFVN